MTIKQIALPATMCAAFGLSGMTIAAATAQAQAAPEQPVADAEQATQLDTISVLGSRRIGRSSDTRTLVPVDVLPMADAAEKGAQQDLAQTLQYAVPSFNSTRQNGADGADLIDSAALRGLGSDQTLVLMNGKRRHTVALVNLFGARNRGNTGTDLNAIPILAIDRIEILRDGAAAQYGSDAIAGVMNIALKKSKGCEALAGYSQYTRGDGESWLGSSYCGFGIGQDGVLAVTAEYSDRGRSDRSEPDDPRIIGDSKVRNSTLYLNGELPMGETAVLYFTGGLQQRDASSAAFARGGIGTDDIPSRNSAAMYPDGFVPFIDGEIEDRYATLGLRWLWGEWNVDLSTTYGYNEFAYTINNTLNASIANLDLLNGGAGISPDSFDAGGFSFRQSTTNLDFSRYFDGIAQGMNIAFGAEFRDENYQIFAGEPGSFIDADGPGIGGNAGSQGFPGFQPSDETDSSRDSYAAYVDVETTFTERLTVDVAARYEHYSDFGSTLNGKIAAALRATDALTFRGSVSTGFRAPSLQQRFFSSTFSEVSSGVPLLVLLAPNGGAVANAAGIPSLTEETSTSYTLGLAWQPNDAFSMTVDIYRIDIDDRIVLSGRFGTDDPNIGAILESLGVDQAQFFVNSVDTKTEGIDITMNHEIALGGGTLKSFLGYNWSRTEVVAIHAPPALVGREDVLLQERERLFIEQGAPGSKAVLGFDYSYGAWDAGIKFIYFGSQELGTFSGTAAGVPNAKYGDKASADVSLTYSFTDRMKLTVGGANVFDSFPDEQDANETDNGFKFESVQFGLNGASVFARFWVGF